MTDTPEFDIHERQQRRSASHKAGMDTYEWQQARNAKLLEWVGDHEAVRFIVDFADIYELFDDLIDKDKPIEDAHVIRVLFKALIEYPMNPFFDRNKVHLMPIIVTGLNAWLDANDLEKRERDDKVLAFVLRTIYAELIFYIIYLTRGRDYLRSVSLDVREFFTRTETIDEYLEYMS